MGARVLKISRENPDLEGLQQAVEVLQGGGLVAFPTDTVYGVGVSIFRPEGIKRLYAVKGRPLDKPLPVLVPNLEKVQQIVEEIPESALTLIQTYWPGPLTLVFLARPVVPEEVRAGRPTVGVRMPDHPVALALLHLLSEPLATPSANPSGQKEATTAEEVLQTLGKELDLILDAGPSGGLPPSTVLDVSSFPPKILRKGPVLKAELERILGQEVSDDC